MILHLCVLDKFIAPFYEFIDEHFADFQSRHLFYINGVSSIYRIPKGENLYIAQDHKPAKIYDWLIRSMNCADKIILHGLWDVRVLLLLTVQPWLLRKCYWVIWGGDLYTYQLDQRSLRWWRNEVFRRFVIKRLGHLITHIKGDYELAKKWYGSTGQWHECFTYTSNIHQKALSHPMLHDGINILLGNSADPGNNHIEVLDKLKTHTANNIRIYCPLSYGDQLYAQKVSDYGKSLFGEKFIPLRDFMSLEKYNDLLAKTDIGIFNHKRQQAMGNITTLIGLGKKVYISSKITTWDFFQSLGLKVFDVSVIDLLPIESKISKNNALIASNYFSKANLISQLVPIFRETI
jgi:dTDP-N-acetylfucosamine:lipid II N-acetylfucosaminyltransferase